MLRVRLDSDKTEWERGKAWGEGGAVLLLFRQDVAGHGIVLHGADPPFTD